MFLTDFNFRFRYTFAGNNAKLPLDPTYWKNPSPALTFGWGNPTQSAVGKLGPLEEFPALGAESAAGMRGFNSANTYLYPICEFEAVPAA